MEHPLAFEQYLTEEWRPALGCTEPASIAFAASTAAAQVGGEVRAVHLLCDARMYKNCYAVGMLSVDREILEVLQEKLAAVDPPLR